MSMRVIAATDGTRLSVRGKGVTTTMQPTTTATTTTTATAC